MSRWNKEMNTEEYKDDPMLRELHDIRRTMREETRHLSPKEVVAYFKQRANKFLRG